jgi:hypothetical protein
LQQEAKRLVLFFRELSSKEEVFNMKKKIKKAFIPAAGLGTRFLPATKEDKKNKEQSLEELGLPLEGVNVFNPLTIEIGDPNTRLILKLIQVLGTDAFPFDTLIAEFEGNVYLYGT